MRPQPRGLRAVSVPRPRRTGGTLDCGGPLHPGDLGEARRRPGDGPGRLPGGGWGGSRAGLLRGAGSRAAGEATAGRAGGRGPRRSAGTRAPLPPGGQGPARVRQGARGPLHSGPAPLPPPRGHRGTRTGRWRSGEGDRGLRPGDVRGMPPRAGGRDCARPASPRSWRVPSPPLDAAARDGGLGARGARGERGAPERGAQVLVPLRGEERGLGETGRGARRVITGPNAAEAIGDVEGANPAYQLTLFLSAEKLIRVN